MKGRLNKVVKANTRLVMTLRMHSMTVIAAVRGRITRRFDTMPLAGAPNLWWTYDYLSDKGGFGTQGRGWKISLWVREVRLIGSVQRSGISSMEVRRANADHGNLVAVLRLPPA